MNIYVDGNKIESGLPDKLTRSDKDQIIKEFCKKHSISTAGVYIR